MDINDINEKDILIHSPELLTRRVYGYRISDPHQNILDHIDAHQSTLDLAPRGSGKTRVLTIGWATWKVINNPDLRVLIVSDTDGHAVRFLKTIKTALEVSDTIKNYYGDLRGDTWTDHEITLSGRSKIFTEATITAHGMYSGAVTSGHYDIIIADDLINFDNSRTEGQRERAKDWFKTTLLPTLLTDGEIHVLGTRYNPQDLYQFVIDELGYDVQIQRAIGDDGTSICEWLLPLNDKIINGKIHEGLTTKREKLGSIIFDLQYQNDVELMKTGKIFKYDYFQFYEELPSTSAVYMGIDPAISKKSTADYFALCAIGIVGTDIYIFDAYRAKGLSIGDQVELIKKKWDEWQPRIVGIENLSYQEALSQLINSGYPEIRTEGIATSKDKVSRAYLRSGLFENGKVHVRKDQHLFIDELVLFPDAAHDDQFDAFDFAMTVADLVGAPPPKPDLPKGPELPGFKSKGIPKF